MARRATGRWLIAALLAAAQSPAEEPPSLELLLHLAEFSDADGKPIAPEDAEAMLLQQENAEPPPHGARGQEPETEPADPRTKERARTQDEPPHDPD